MMLLSLAQPQQPRPRPLTPALMQIQPPATALTEETSVKDTSQIIDQADSSATASSKSADKDSAVVDNKSY